MTDLINVRNLKVGFDTRAGRIEAVRGVSFRIRAGSCVALVGESGSGKSVCARAIMGILPRNAGIDGGEILFADPKAGGAVQDLAALDPYGKQFRAIRGGRISIIFQEPMTSLSPLHTIGDQISEGLRLHENLVGKAAEDRCVEMLELVRFPDPKRAYRTYPFELSGGLRQRAMIAMALVCGPALLIADEPTTALDVTVQAQILGLIKDLQKELGMAVLMITHDMGVVANVAEEVVVVYQGEVMESGTLFDIFENPGHDYLKALLAAVPHFEMKEGERLAPLRAIEHRRGRLLEVEKTAKPVNGRGDTILEVSGLDKCFTIRKGKGDGAVTRTVKAVDNVSFGIQRGECLGLVGESGCGKTTVSKIIMHAIDGDSGSVRYIGEDGPVDLSHLSEKEMVPYRNRIQYIFQDPFGSLNPRMTVYDILSEPMRIHRVGDRAYRKEMVVELMELVGLEPKFLNRYPHSFSGGQRQRIGIARALALKPEIVICDEPVSALDVSVQAQVLNLLKDLQDELGLTLLFISHDLAVVKYVADRIAVMCRGRLVEMASRDSLFRAPRHPYTKALLASVPFPDLSHPLDFAAVQENVMTEPGNWPWPFDADGDGDVGLIDVGGGHFVRARENPGDTAPA